TSFNVLIRDDLIALTEFLAASRGHCAHDFVGWTRRFRESDLEAQHSSFVLALEIKRRGLRLHLPTLRGLDPDGAAAALLCVVDYGHVHRALLRSRRERIDQKVGRKNNRNSRGDFHIASYLAQRAVQ